MSRLQDLKNWLIAGLKKSQIEYKNEGENEIAESIEKIINKIKKAKNFKNLQGNCFDWDDYEEFWGDDVFDKFFNNRPFIW